MLADSLNPSEDSNESADSGWETRFYSILFCIAKKGKIFLNLDFNSKAKKFFFAEKLSYIKKTFYKPFISLISGPGPEKPKANQPYKSRPEKGCRIFTGNATAKSFVFLS